MSAHYLSCQHTRVQATCNKRTALLSVHPLTLAVHIALTGSVAIAALHTAPVQAQTHSSYQQQTEKTVRTYRIAGGPLSEVLTQFASEAGILLAGASHLGQQHQSTGLVGSFTTQAALDQLLKNTGLEARQQAPSQYVLRQLNADEPSLPEVTVSASSTLASETTGVYTATRATATATPLAMTLKETPQSVTVVTRQRLDDQKLDSLIDALENTTGITAFRQGMGTDLSGLWSRGFTVSNYQIDGIPSAFGASNYRQSTAMYDRVEVTRGASGLMSGMGDPSATINLIRKRPTTTQQLAVGIETGSWQRYGANADLSLPFNESGTVRGRLVADYKTQDSWIDRYKKKTAVLYGIVEADISSATLFSAGFSHQKDDNTAPLRTGHPLRYSNGVATNFDRSTNTAPNWSYYNNEINNIFASLSHAFANGWSGKVEVNHAQYKYDGATYFLNGAIDQITGLGGVLWPVRWQSADKQTSIDAQLSGTFPLFGKEHDLVTGISLSQNRMQTPGYGGWVGPWTGYDGAIGNLHTWDGSANVPNFVKETDTLTKENIYSAYVTSRFYLGDTTNIILGVRAMDWESHAGVTKVTGEYSETTVKEKGVIIPYAGIVHALNDTWSVYSSYTKIFKPQSASTRDINNAILSPEKGTSYEAGIKAGFAGGKLNASLAAFKTQQDNVAFNDISIGAFRALEGIATKGLELEFTGELQRDWHVTFGHTYTESKDKDGKAASTQIPRNSTKFFTTYRMPGALSDLIIGGGVNWQSDYGYVGEYQQGSYALVNLMARYAFTNKLSGSININNVFDKTYYSGLSAFGGVYGAPRNVMATLKYQF